MGGLILSGKLLMGLAGTVLALLAASSPRLRRLSDARFGALAVGFGVASRLALFFLVFVALRMEAQSDVGAFYYPQARSALAGQLVNRDFPSSYAPLFPYLGAVAVALWDSPKSLILLAVALEALSLPLWLRTARALFDEGTARLAMILYVTSALPLVDVAIEGQNHTYCALLLAASFAFLVAGRPFLSGLAAGASVAAVKLLGVITAAGPFAGAGNRRARWLAGGALVPALVYGAFALAGADVLLPVRIESGQRTSGNLPFLLTALGAGAPTGAWSSITVALLACSLVGVLLWALRSGAVTGPRAALHLTTLLLLTFQVVSKKAASQYLVLGYFPVAATVAACSPGWRGILAFGLFGTVATLEPSLWFRLLPSSNLSALWQPGLRGSALVVLAFNLVLVGGYAVLGWQALRLLAPRRAAPR